MTQTNGTPFLIRIRIPSIDTCNLIISNVRTPPTHFPTRVFANINKSIDIDKVSTPATHIQTRIVPDAKTVLEEIERLSAKKRTVRYPGDIDVSVDMSPEKARQNLLLCQSKIKAQAKEIYRLKQKTKRQRDQIKRLKGMVRGNSDNPGMEGSQSRSVLFW